MKMDIAEIHTYLPHRYPFLLVDRVTEVQSGELIKGYKNVTFNEQYFQGHFPDAPIMPGVLVLEALAQISGILGFVTTNKKPSENLIHYFAGTNKVRFKRPIVPGDQLVLESKLITAKHNIWKFDCTAYVDGEVACTAEIMTAEKERPFTLPYLTFGINTMSDLPMQIHHSTKIDASASIHPSAIIGKNVAIGANVVVGPWCLIGDGVEIGDDCELLSHVVVKGPTVLGKANRIFQFSSIGEECQDKKYAGEPTRLEIGDRNIIRENCTIHRGTVQDQGLTKIGSDNLLMAYVHVAHDCVVGDKCILANNTTLAGHVHVADHVILGGGTMVHQFCQIGAHSMSAGGSIVLRDIPAYVMASGQSASAHGLNSEGLKRRGFTSEQILSLKRAYKVVFRQGLNLKDALSELAPVAKSDSIVKVFVDSIEKSNRGIIR